MLALTDTCHATADAKGRLCACLEPAALGILRAMAGDGRVDPHVAVYRQGSPAQYLYGLRQGAIMLFSQLPDGRRQVLSFLFPGDTFGFSVQGLHANSAVALTRSSLCQIPVAALDRDPLLTRRLNRIAQSWQCDAQSQALRLGRMTADERVSDFLHQLWCRLGRPDTLHLPMRWVDIGDYLGLRPETVSRAFSALRRQGIIGALSHDGLLPVTDSRRLEHRVAAWSVAYSIGTRPIGAHHHTHPSPDQGLPSR